MCLPAARVGCGLRDSEILWGLPTTAKRTDRLKRRCEGDTLLWTTFPPVSAPRRPASAGLKEPSRRLYSACQGKGSDLFARLALPPLSTRLGRILSSPGTRNSASSLFLECPPCRLVRVLFSASLRLHNGDGRNGSGNKLESSLRRPGRL